MYSKVRKAGGILLLAGMMMLAGCGKKKEKADESSYQVELKPIATMSNELPQIKGETKKDHNGLVQNDINGSWVKPEEDKNRYIAVMINNIDEAMPQSGIEQADIIYECVVEGGITRLMALYSNTKGLEKIGPIRSARHYYDRATIGMDAIYVHVGQSIFAEADFENYPLIDDINGSYDGGFYRDNSRVAPHNCYISADAIEEQIKEHEYTRTKRSNAERMYLFNEEDTELKDGKTANKVTCAFHSGRQPWFEYDSATKLYKRFQYGEEQIDDQTGNQLTFKNLLIKICPYPLVEGTESMMDPICVGSGTGYYATDGKIIPVTWSRPYNESVTHYYREDGTEIMLNPGKTYITVFPDSGEISYE